jgi:hypothetical protein
VGAVLPATGDYTLSTGQPGSDCASPRNGGPNTGTLPTNGPLSEVTTPGKDIRLGALPYTRNFKVDYQDPFQDVQTHVRSTLTITGGGRHLPISPRPRGGSGPRPTPRGH